MCQERPSIWGQLIFTICISALGSILCQNVEGMETR